MDTDALSRAAATGSGKAFAVAAAIAIVSLLLLYTHSFRSSGSPQWIPRVGTNPGWFGLARAKRDFIANGSKIVEEGYRKYKDSAFKLQTGDMERIVLSAKYIDEIRAAPEAVLSLREGMCQRHLGRYTTLDIILTSHLQNDICKTELTQNLHSFVPSIHDEAEYWLNELLPTVAQFHELPGYETVLRLVSGTSSRVYVGLPLSRNAEWLETVAGYTFDVFQVSQELRPYPALLRPLIAPWLGCTNRLRRHIRNTENLFGDELRGLLSGRPSNTEREHNLIQSLVEMARGRDRSSTILIKKLLFLTLAAIHTSTMSTTHALFDLCSMPEYIDPLREEIREVIGSGPWTLASLNRLKLLDSFMKESQRMNHPGLLSFNRRVMEPLRLSDGLTIPANTFISMATNCMARDPMYYEDPHRFDGFRFYNLRTRSQDDASRHQFVSTGAGNLAFGHGKFACPGRFFAGAQIKLVLASIISRYDVSFPGSQTERPRNTFAGEGIGADREQRVVFTPRRLPA